MQEDPDVEEARRRAHQAAHSLYGVPSYQGHWSGAVLFAATLVGATMLWSCLPMAMAIMGGEGEDRTAATFLVLYSVMALGPVGGWILWGLRRRWAAMAVVALVFACAVWLGPAVSQ